MAQFKSYFTFLFGSKNKTERRSTIEPAELAATLEAAAASLFEEEDVTESNIYRLTEHRMKRFHQVRERRAIKNQLSDRRAQPRFTASGEIQPDRRSVNRAANIRQMKKTG